MNQTEISKIANSDFQVFKEFVMQPTPKYETKESYDYNKVLAGRYPFLIPVYVWTGKINPEDREPYDYKSIQGFWGGGWKELFLSYCEHIKPEFDRLIEETRKKIGSNKKGTPSIEELDELRKERLPYITDYKEKYGEMRIYWTEETEAMSEATTIVTMLSRVTCSLCGRVPKTSKGRHLIWETGGWISYYCKDCFKIDQLNSYNKKYRFKNDAEKVKFKDYLKSCRIEHPKYFIINSWYKNEHSKTYYTDDGNGWLKVAKKEIIKEEK